VEENYKVIAQGSIKIGDRITVEKSKVRKPARVKFSTPEGIIQVKGPEKMMKGVVRSPQTWFKKGQKDREN